MSALTSPARLDQPSRDIPSAPNWRRLLRVTWFQHRGAFISFLALALVFLFAVAIEGSRATGSYAGYVADGCVAHALSHTSACNSDALALGGLAEFRGIGLGLDVLPLLVGIFIGAPLVSRELESGTFRFAWTQGISRTRLILTKLVVLAIAATIMSLVLGLVFGGWYAHTYEVVLGVFESQWQATLFTTTWWMLTAWTLFALAVGTLLGALIKRTVAAMAATAGIIGGLLLVARLLLPQVLGIGALVSSRLSMAYLGVGPINSQAQTGSGAPLGSWLVRSWLTGPRGKVLDTMATQNVVSSANGKSAGHLTVAQWLASHHDTFWVAYQPASHFWIVQGAMGAVLVLLAAGCTALVLRSVRTRSA